MKNEEHRNGASDRLAHSPAEAAHPLVSKQESGADSTEGAHEAEILDTLRRLAGTESVPHFLRLRAELLDWNTRINLTAITDPVEVLLKHFLDSLALLKASEAQRIRVLDIGAGAGFPGLPLKIARPNWELVLLEATGKKVAFQQHIIELLRLSGIEALHGRAEEVAHRPEYRGTFNLVTARAVATLPTLLEYAAPFCRAGGQVILPKKGDLAAELEQSQPAARILGLTFKADLPVALPGLDDDRRILVWEQTRPCPPQYPRSSSAIAKKPLGQRDHR